MVARDIVARAHKERVPGAAALVYLSGDLGAGKTTLTQAIAQELGVTSPVQSPTYVLMRSYQTNNEGFSTLVHIDAYRLETPEHFNVLEPEKLFTNEQALILVEWPEKALGILPQPTMAITLAHVPGNADTRTISYGA